MIDFDGTLNAAISSVFGDEAQIVYFGQPGVGTPIAGVFTLITDRVFSEDGTPDANIIIATLGLQLSQLTFTPQQSQTVQITKNAVVSNYVVKDVSLDGLGWAYLDLGAQ